MNKGKVKFYNTEKGYGFIKPDDSEKDVYVNVKNVTGDISKDDEVVFSIEQGPKGLSAIDVKRIG